MDADPIVTRLDRIEALLLQLLDALADSEQETPVADLDGGLHPSGGNAQSLDD